MIGAARYSYYNSTSWLFKLLCSRRPGLKMSTTTTTTTTPPPRASSVEKEYQEAIKMLNSLQTPAEVLKQRQSRQMTTRDSSLVEQQRQDEHYHREPKRKLPKMVEFLERVGMKLSDLDHLNAIHVTGTKGKGSVCAMCEIILRKHNLKTGFFSSPHLLEVRERIRLNGVPLSKDMFVMYFWQCYNKLKETKELGMPTYFKFLTIMSFLVFLREKVDVAVVEVGVGGAYDCTNIIPKPAVCAISSLGYDHMEVLGETLEKISWQKAGICKPGCPAFTSPQFPSPMRVLEERATELGASSLLVAPPLHEYSLKEKLPLKLSLSGDHQTANASLAAQACRSWLQGRGKWTQEPHKPGTPTTEHLHGVPVASPFSLTREFQEGLEQCRWPGRNQVIKKGHVTYYLDGAHTPQSIKACAEWFKCEALKESRGINGSVVRVLLFNITKKRDSKLLMQALLECGFSYAAFSPNIATTQGNSADQTKLTVTVDSQYARTQLNRQAWLEVNNCLQTATESVEEKIAREREGLVTSAPDPLSLCGGGGRPGVLSLDFKAENSRAFTCVSDVVKWCSRPDAVSSDSASLNGSMSSSCGGDGDGDGPSSHTGPHPEIAAADHVQLLVTGSLHLVGAAMSVLGCRVEDL